MKQCRASHLPDYQQAGVELLGVSLSRPSWESVLCVEEILDGVG